jgi:hypothetical protein
MSPRATSSIPTTSGRPIALYVLCGTHQNRALCARAVPKRYTMQEDPMQQDCPVPKAQQPVFELRQLQDDSIFSLAVRPFPTFIGRLAAVYVGTDVCC